MNTTIEENLRAEIYSSYLDALRTLAGLHTMGYVSNDPPPDPIGVAYREQLEKTEVQFSRTIAWLGFAALQSGILREDGPFDFRWSTKADGTTCSFEDLKGFVPTQGPDDWAAEAVTAFSTVFATLEAQGWTAGRDAGKRAWSFEELLLPTRTVEEFATVRSRTISVMKEWAIAAEKGKIDCLDERGNMAEAQR